MLYTIGSSNRTPDEFFGELKKRGIGRLIDVRSAPRSRFEHFRHPNILMEAAGVGVKYAWHGQLLGGMNEISTETPEYRKLADMVLELASEQNVAVFCAEGDPKDCHRSWKIGSYALVTQGLVVTNILRNGQDEDVTKTLLRTDPGNIPPCLRNKALELACKAEGVTWVDKPVQQALPLG